MNWITRTGLAAMLAAGALALSGCGAILDRVEEGIEAAASAEGQSIDIELNGNESCLPEGMRQPGGTLIASQGISGAGTSRPEICVESSMYERDEMPPLTVRDGFEVIEGSQLPEAIQAMALLFAEQAGLPDEQVDALMDPDTFKDLKPLDDGDAVFRVFGSDNGRILMLACPDVNAPQVQVTVGLMCEGSCD